jgi:outer membrane protein assembly factor BamB
MNIDRLVFVGLNGRVSAVDRDSGEIVWETHEKWAGDVSLLLDGDRLIAALNGYLYCFDPRDGRVLWQNPLKGYGCGVAALTSVRGQSSQTAIQQAAAAEAQRAAASTHVHTGS